MFEVQGAEEPEAFLQVFVSIILIFQPDPTDSVLHHQDEAKSHERITGKLANGGNTC